MAAVKKESGEHPYRPGRCQHFSRSFTLARERRRRPRIPMARLRLLTFNIAHARGPSPIPQSLRRVVTLRRNLQRIAHLIPRLKVDIVALQEIDETSRWAGSFDHLAYLAEQTGLAHAVHGI